MYSNWSKFKKNECNQNHWSSEFPYFWRNKNIEKRTKTLKHAEIHGFGKKLSSTGFNVISENNTYNGIKWAVTWYIIDQN